ARSCWRAIPPAPGRRRRTRCWPRRSAGTNGRSATWPRSRTGATGRSPCWGTPPTRCCPTLRRGRPWRSRTRRCWRSGWRQRPAMSPARCAITSGSGARAPRAPSTPPAPTRRSIISAAPQRRCARSRSWRWAASASSPATIGSMAGRRPDALRSDPMPLFPTTIAGSLPKPAWLAEPDRLWAPWRLDGGELAAGQGEATLLALKLQEDAGIDVVTDGEQSRQHFVHGFLEFVDGIDFAHKVEIGIRADRYKAMVPTVTSALRLKGRVHGREARLA